MGYPALVRKFVSKTFQKLAQSCHAGSDKKRLKFETFVFSSVSLERKKERKKETEITEKGVFNINQKTREGIKSLS